jgi:putative heme-binding domain-containing protein
MLRLFASFVVLSLCVAPSLAEDPFALGVRETPHLSPEEQQQRFTLPPGFEIQLVAAEPKIQKPLNMAFDARGRLWITDTVEYPYAAPPDKPARDSIKILEDTNNDGRADKIITFAEGLNIPIGILPYKNGVIAYSIPNIYYFEDTDGDDKCDRRTKLYGPFDYSRDTHGMQNAFRRGYDGWIYACHGFNNDSHVRGADGNEVHLNSGNTYRFRPDGSRIEHFTVGQVNPFGMCFDDLFNIFTADCHSKPITQLLRGGNYESFGKPHDGLGYVPPMMDHLHGSTAICGLAIVDGENFPSEYRGQFLSGNVMTSRINRNTRVYHGSTITCKEEPDFLSTEDPWFRPVDLQMGPDGALYIADFYNRIIGHYEVPLPHPGRDRVSGRLWRVVYRGDAEGTRAAERQPDLTQATAEELIAALDHAVLPQRLLAADELVHRLGRDAAADVLAALKTSGSERQRVQLHWIAHRLGGDVVAQLPRNPLYDDEASPLEQTHALKAAAEQPPTDAAKIRAAALERLLSEDAFTARAAADALGRHTAASNLLPLIERLKHTSAHDNHLTYVLRRAIRDTLLAVKDTRELEAAGITAKTESAILAPIALGVPNATGAALCVAALVSEEQSPEALLPYVTHAARYAEGNVAQQLTEIVRRRWSNDLELQLKALLALHQGLAQRGESSVAVTAWAEELGTKLLARDRDEVIAWENHPLAGSNDTENPWVFQQRASADGNTQAQFYSSLVRGEQRTGIYRSQPFELPAKLSFWCAGHIGPPNEKTLDLNFIRLRDATTGALLAEARPPRNDVAQRITWDLAPHAGRQAYVELIDGDSGGAYAWLAVGRFSVPGLNPSLTSQRRQAVAQLAAQLKLQRLKPQLIDLLTSATSDAATRSRAAEAIVALQPDARGAALVRVIDAPHVSADLKHKCAIALAGGEAASTAAALAEAMRVVPASVQTSAAETLAGDTAGAEALLAMVEQGQASAGLLRMPAVKQKLVSLKLPRLERRAEELTARLPPADEVIDRLVAERRTAFEHAQPDLERGAQVFVKNCANCHQVAGKGALVGPQLDGIGQRGLERVIEDVLDPNRNVDVAFRTSTLALSDGRVISGLVKRTEGELLVVVDNQGKEQQIHRGDVEERVATPLSLMPANVAELVSPADFHHLVGYLLAQKAKPAE